VLLAISIGLGVLLLAEPSGTSLSVGALLVLAGEALRLWATGHLFKTERLTVSGPYRFLRHPLYAGTLLIVSGLILAAGAGVARWALPLGLAHFFFYYLPYKERGETRRLQARHGAAFDDYRAAVPAILPRLTPWDAGGSSERWRISQVVENDELGTAVAALLYFSALAFKAL
jgi:protein-S-isoprenylcysteine O-methyltransferase Ste14